MNIRVGAKAAMLIAIGTIEARLLLQGSYGVALGFLCLLPAVVLARSVTAWKVLFAVFGLLAVMFIFVVFGGLEPNSPGTLQTQGFFSLDTLLFASLIVAVCGAAAAGFTLERSGRAHPRGGA